MNRTLVYISALLILLFFSCYNVPKNGKEFFKLANSKVSQKIDNLNYELTFLPNRYRQNNEDNHSNLFNFKLKIEDGSNQSFMLSGSPELQSEKLSYYTENIRRDIRIIMQKDTIPCGMVICERNYNMYTYTNLLLSFDLGERKINEARVEVVDRLMNTGKLNFTFTKRILTLN